MFMPFEIVSICVWLWYFFSEMCRTAAYSNLHEYHMLGLHVTDKCLEQFIGTLVVPQFVKQSITVDLFPHILANVVELLSEQIKGNTSFDDTSMEFTQYVLYMTHIQKRFLATSNSAIFKMAAKTKWPTLLTRMCVVN